MSEVNAERVEAAGSAPLDLEEVSCNLCGANDTRFLYGKPDTRFWTTDDEWKVVQCRRCSLAYLDPRPTPASMGRFYPARFYDNREVEKQQKRYEIQATFLADRRPGRLLDIGCATGSYLKFMQDRGWDVQGMDRFEVPNTYSLPIRYGDLPELAYPSDHFDDVTSWAVFEHLHDPLSYFREVGRILRPGGRFVCLVTNINSVWSRYAFEEDIPRHLYFFNRSSLSGYGEKSGLKLRDLDHTGRLFKPDTTDVFRKQLLHRLGYSWREILAPPPPASQWLSLATKVASRMGSLLFSGSLEQRLKICGIIIAVFEKA